MDVGNLSSLNFSVDNQELLYKSKWKMIFNVRTVGHSRPSVNGIIKGDVRRLTGPLPHFETLGTK